MLFTSPEFLFAFLPLTLAGFHLLRRAGQPQLCVPFLFVASMAFYAWWSPRFLILLTVSMLVNWGAAHAMARLKDARRKSVFVLGLVWNLGILAYFKYADFFITSLDTATGLDWPLLHIVLPLGISFFTFQKIAYLADIHAGIAKPGPLSDFALFVFFFPQLIAGPIVHHAEVMPQFRAMASRSHETDLSLDTAIGLTLLIIGLVKKVLVADHLAPYATKVFDIAAAGNHRIGMLAAWQGALAYTVQLYADFSGYSDMAIGLARMFGVKLPANFDSPYKSLSIIEFWRRWHMTLSRFLRDYLYVPLGGNRKGPARRYVNLMITMLLGGLWHGAGWTYVAWGGLHGLYLLVNHFWRSLVRHRLPAPIGLLLTLTAVISAWVFFRASDFASAANIVAGMFGLHGAGDPIPGVKKGTGVILAALALGAMLILPNSQQIMRRFAPVIGPVEAPGGPARRLLWAPSMLTAALGAGAIIAVVLFSWGTTEFLYFQF
ncbi:D-alanyl-lipoteichoic acid acyltransferase DltB, MBOAT superfamily [Rhizobiales bacterium GAS191]|nr:D-alanyl-lipoteichoic acid acyltransferase DltB, MBOAT superfamily [Rhizobiales bacterium GAS191]